MAFLQNVWGLLGSGELGPKCLLYCCGSVPLTNGSGSGSGSCYFRQTATKNVFPKLLCLLLFEATFTSLFKDKKVTKKSQNSRNEGFSKYFCLMIEESRSVPRTNGSGSGTLKNIRILQIRLGNTGHRYLQ